MTRLRLLCLVFAIALLATLLPTTGAPVAAQTPAPETGSEPSDEAIARDSLRQLTDEVFYFVMPDRFANGTPTNDTGGIEGGRLDHGFDPTNKGFFHGGDLQGLQERLDYIEGLGVTAIWMTPSFANRPVQGSGDDISAGYHGYWVTDFTRLDPHFGTNEQLTELIAAAHDRGIKVFFDIITNHTADVIKYAEGEYAYRGKGPWPYLDADGFPFDDDAYAGTGTFPELDPRLSFPYTPVFPTEEDAVVKEPDWLNDRTMYHNRGDSTFVGESSLYGDFFGLDDLFTERPEVVEGMIEIHKDWISEFGIDGFRVDTVKHVNTEFWKAFAPAIMSHARKTVGDEDFYLFGEVFDSDPAFMSRYTTEARLPAVLDFGFQANAHGFAAQSNPTTALRDFFAADDWYIDEDSNAYGLPTFLGNHDMGRIGRFVAQANADADDAELLARDRLAHELMYFARGMPVIYYGDEQGFTGDGGDKDARQDMFESRVASYNDDDLIGTDATTAEANFDTGHPLYERIAELSALRAAHPTLRSGAQIHRYATDGPGIYAFSRLDDEHPVEYIVVLNNAEQAQTASIPTYSAGTTFAGLYPDGADALTSRADRSLEVTVPPLSAVVYRAEQPVMTDATAPGVSIVAPDPGGALAGRAELRAEVAGEGFAQVTFAAKVGDAQEWEVLGTDDSAPYRVFFDAADHEPGALVQLKAVVQDLGENLNSAYTTAVIGAEETEEPPPGFGTPERTVVHIDGGGDGWTAIFSGAVENAGEAQPLVGEDDYGRFAWAKLAEDAGQVDVTVTDGETVVAEAGYHPTTSPEIWLKQGGETVYDSQAAAQGYVELHYHRPDGSYDGWGLHLWGEAISEEVATDWADPRMPDELTEYGASWRVPITDASQPLNFIVHKGDEQDPQEDRSFVPARQPAAWLVSGESPVHATRAKALDLAVLHYHRPDGDYDGWGLHVWSGARNPTEWTAPLQPVGQDAFGLIFEVPLVEDATELAYIIHKGDEKDLPADQFLDLQTLGHEVWMLSGIEEYLLPIPRGGGPDANLDEPRAHWIDATTLLWNLEEPSAAKEYALVYALDGGLEVTSSGVTGGESVPLAYARPSLFSYDPALAEVWPHLADYAVFRIAPENRGVIEEGLKGQLAVTESVAGQLQTATGVQIPGVLDDLYANDADLGVSWDGDVPTLRLWAPTARSVTLHLFDDLQADSAQRRGPGPPGETVTMERDPETGVWSATGEPGWDRRYYLYEVEVFTHETGQVERNVVTDPYSLSLATNSTKSQIVDLSDADLRPPNWEQVRNPAPARPEAASIYELHVRDFSIKDESVPPQLQGTYGAFTLDESDGMRHLRRLADRGLSYVHLLPSFDFATIDEVDANWLQPEDAEGCEDLSTYPPDSPRQQECVMSVADNDGYNWGYDPYHYTTPEGGYAVDPMGASRVREFRAMVAGLNRSGLGVVMDVVYNHTHASGQGDARSVLDRIVPGYYHRLLEDGTVATSTCCPNTATEHAMMEKLMVDSVVTWARDYKVDGFRFDLMGHHSKQNMLAVRSALDALTAASDGVDGSEVYVYGEGWNFGEVADNARFTQATQLNMAGTGIGTFNDRLRDAVRGGGPFDADPRLQGFASGLYTDPNDAPQGTEAQQRDRLLLEMDRIRVGLAGNLADYEFINRDGELVTGAEVPYGGAPTGYTADPAENIVYVAAHDNETLFDALAFKLPTDLPILERVRMQQVGLSTVAYSQGVSFFHAGTDLLRSKSFDRNSYDSGDWFNELDWSKRSNNYASGLPPAPDNEDKWPYAAPRLRNDRIDPPPWALRWSTRRFSEMLLISQTSPLFRLRTGDQVRERLRFHNTGEGQIPGLIAMTVSDREDEQLDPLFASVTVAFNGSDKTQRLTVDELAGRLLILHPFDRFSVDRRARRARFLPRTGTLVVPPRVTVAFLEPGVGVRGLATRLRERVSVEPGGSEE